VVAAKFPGAVIRNGMRFAPSAPHPTAADEAVVPKRDSGSARLAQIFPHIAPLESTSGNPSFAPLKWTGMLIVPNPTAKDPNLITICTAQFVRPNVLLTAGHCLRDLPENPSGPWPDATKGGFWLQYQNNSGIYFHVVCAATNPQWAYPANFKSLSQAQQNAAFPMAAQHDYALILVDANSPTGTMPYALDWKGKYSSAIRIGYPSAILDSAIPQKATGIVFFASTLPMGIDSQPNLVVHWGPSVDATQGMSGGAWVANFNLNEGPNNNFAISVSSYENPNNPGASFGAYLTAAEFNPLLTFVSNGCK